MLPVIVDVLSYARAKSATGLGGMAGVRGAVGELFEEDGLGELHARLKGRPKVEVEPDVGMVSVLDSKSIPEDYYRAPCH